MTCSHGSTLRDRGLAEIKRCDFAYAKQHLDERPVLTLQLAVDPRGRATELDATGLSATVEACTETKMRRRWRCSQPKTTTGAPPEARLKIEVMLMFLAACRQRSSIAAMRWMSCAVTMVITFGCGRKDEPGPPPKLASGSVAVVPPADVARADFPDVEPTSPPPKPTLKPGRGDCKVEYAPKPTRDPNPMCKVPALKFRMGTDDPEDKFRAQRPAFDVELSAYYIDQFEVTTDQIAHYLNAVGDNTCSADPAGQCFCVKGCWPRELERSGNRFVVVAGRERVATQHVSLEGARRYCAWVGKQLPTEAQWEAAARFDPATGTAVDYPWGGTYEKNRAHEGDKPLPVGAYDGTGGRGDGASPLGVHDLAAGVAERIDGCWQAYPLCSSPPCKDPAPAPIHPGCGGLYRNMGVGLNNTRGTHRSSGRLESTSGFRCARAGHG